MVTITTRIRSTGASAHDPRASDTAWQRRSVERPLESATRVGMYVRHVARASFLVATAIALALLIADVTLAVRQVPGAFGTRLEIAFALVLVVLAATFESSTRPFLRRAATIILICVGAYGLGGLMQLFANEIGPGTPPANTALLFATLGLGIPLARHGSIGLRWLSDGLVIGSGAIAMFALVALLFGSDIQYPLAASTKMTVPPALIGLLLALGTMLRRQDFGLGKLLGSDSTGGVLARRLVPVLLIAPILIARLAYLGVQAETYDAAFAISCGIMIGVTVLAVVLVGSARVLDRLDLVRRGNEAQIRQMVGDIARQSKELQRTNQELESFSYSVSHDLRAPIRHIAGFCELLMKQSTDKLDGKAKHYLAMITDSANQAGKLIDDLLEFSRMGRTAMAVRPIPIADLVRDVWADLAPERAGREIELRVGPLPTAHADPAMFKLVVANLLSNAIKYTARAPRALIEVEGHEDAGSVGFVVRDNGVGFDMKYVNKLFGVFQRLHGDEFEGVGIGLANVKRIVERHGGRVWAEGAVDRGASFYISLPRAKEANA